MAVVVVAMGDGKYPGRCSPSWGDSGSRWVMPSNLSCDDLFVSLFSISSSKAVSNSLSLRS